MRILSVYELVHYLKEILEADSALENVLFTGEIGNFTSHASGHLYFSLKDERSKINCVMFRSQAINLNFLPKNGDRVIVKARISIFEAQGQMQAYISQMKLEGIGDLYRQFDLLRRKLAALGLFDPSHKKTKPLYPLKVAVLTGDRSAALSDIKTTFARRWPLCHYDIYPVLVQGEDSAADIILNLKRVDQAAYDAIILARGGGSIEDLWSFNDEALVYTIYKLQTFIITGIGHEQDYTLADFVADLRAPTPTAAVELLTPNQKDVYENILGLKKQLSLSLDRLYQKNKEAYNSILNRLPLKNKYYLAEVKRQQLDYLESQLKTYAYRFKELQADLQQKRVKLNYLMALKAQISRNLLAKLTVQLNAYAPKSALKRGYALVYHEGKLLKGIKTLQRDDQLLLEMRDGKIKVKVEA